MKYYLSIFLFSFLCFISNISIAQSSIQTGGKIGLILNFGNPINRIGLTTQFFVNKDFAQINAGIDWYYNFNNYGPDLSYSEWRPSIGLMVGFGKKMEKENPFIAPFYQQTFHKNAFGYTFFWYKNKIGTTQSTGQITLQIDRLFILFENDLLGNTKGKDRFRTGAIAIQYLYKDWLFEIKSVLWTGETRGTNKKKYESNNQYKCRWGYQDISELPFGKHSHGILAASAKRALPYGQTVHFGIGIDAEQIRHFWQNKIIHDMYFLPTKWTKARNYHYPMLDKNGLPCVKEDQEVRKARLFFEVGMNQSGFY